MSELIKLYGISDDRFDHDCPEEATAEIFNTDSDLLVGDVVTVYMAEFKRAMASDFLPDCIAKYMTETAYDKLVEGEADWEFSSEKARDLKEKVSELVDEWCDRHELNCPLWSPVGTLEEARWRLINEDGDFVKDGNLETKESNDGNIEMVSTLNSPLVINGIKRDFLKKYQNTKSKFRNINLGPEDV